MQNNFSFLKGMLLFLWKNTSVLQKMCSLTLITNFIVTGLSLKQKKAVNSRNILNINVADQRDQNWRWAPSSNKNYLFSQILWRNSVHLFQMWM